LHFILPDGGLSLSGAPPPLRASQPFTAPGARIVKMKSERGIRFNLFFAAGFDNGFDVCGEMRGR